MRFIKHFFGGAIVFLLISLPLAYGYETSPAFDTNSLYFGVMGGYGSTTWQSVVARDGDSRQSAPNFVNEGGFTPGIFIGYQFLPRFAIQFTTVWFPHANLHFDEFSAYSERPLNIVSRTHAYAIMGKILIPITNPNFRFYSNIGFSVTHRVDSLADRIRVNPLFGLGIMYDLTSRVVLLVGADLYLGYGRSELDMARSYVPFLYNIHAGLGYRVTL